MIKKCKSQLENPRIKFKVLRDMLAVMDLARTGKGHDCGDAIESSGGFDVDISFELVPLIHITLVFVLYKSASSCC